MDDRIRTTVPNKDIVAEHIQPEAPDVSERLKPLLEAVLRDGYSNGELGHPLLVTKFPKRTGPLFKVTIQINDPESEIHNEHE